MQFCLFQTESLIEAKLHLQTILAPGDKITLNQKENCLEVEADGLRKELYQKLLRSKYRLKNSEKEGSFTTHEQLKPCRLKVEKVGNSTTDEFSVGRKSRLKQTQTKEESVSRAQIVLAPGKEGEISLVTNSGEHSLVTLICRQTNIGTTLVDVQLKDYGSYLSTSVTLQYGRKVNLGNIVEDLKKESKTISATPSIELKKIKGQKSFTYYLSTL